MKILEYILLANRILVERKISQTVIKRGPEKRKMGKFSPAEDLRYQHGKF